MKILRLPNRVPPPNSPSTSTDRISRWLKRSSLGLLALFIAGSASFAVAPAAPEIAIEQPAGITLGNSILAWGDNASGQTSVPAGLTDVQAIAAGRSHTVALKTDGSVVAWGRNVEGQTDVPVAAQSGVQAIAAGLWHTVALKTDGTVIAWGYNFKSSGPTAVPDGLVDVRAIAAGRYHTVALKNDGTVVAWGDDVFDVNGQTDVPVGLTGVRAIAAGGLYTLALMNDGTVVAWGDNVSGSSPVAVPVGLAGVQAIAAGGFHAVALKADGTIVAWGDNVNGGNQTTVPAGLTDVQAIAAGRFHNVALKNNGTIVSWGNNFNGQTTLPAGLPGVRAIAAGDAHTVALVNPVVTFANQIAGTASAAKTFTIKNKGAGALSVTSASVTGGAASDFTVNTTAMLASVPATTGTTTFTVTFTPSAGGLRQTTLRVVSDDADEASYDITLSGTGATAPKIVIEQPIGTPLGKTVVAWGDNGKGQTSVPAGLTGARAIAAGFDYAVALKSDGTVSAWGGNASGQTTVPAGLSHVQAIAAGALHTVALKDDGSVIAWGYNFQGQSNVPAGLTGVQAIAAGFTVSFALKNDGTVVAWGDEFSAQTHPPAGLAGVRALAAGDQHTVALKGDGTVVVWGYSNLTVPAGLADVRAIAAGHLHTVALKNDGTVVAWGDNHSGQTDVPAGLMDVQAITAGFDYTAALKNDGTVVAWGNFPRDVPAGLSGVHAIAAGGTHAVALANPVITFGNQISGTTSEARTFKIKNTGNAALNIASVSLQGSDADDFTVNSDALPVTLPETTGETTFTVTFTPTGGGAKSATLRVVSDDAEEPIYNIPLIGTGVFRDTGFTTDKRAIDLDVLANDPGVNRTTAAFTFLTPPQSGTVRVVGGKIRYIPTRVLPLAGDRFTYQFDDGQGGIGTGTVTIATFANLAGEYDGLIGSGFRRVIPGDGAANHRRSGYLHLSLTKTGVFSGALTFAGTKLNPVAQIGSAQYSFIGRLDSAGNAVCLIARRGLPLITLTIHFDAETRTISGTAESLDGTTPFTSELTLAKRTPAGPLAGTYPVKIVPDGTLGTPGESSTARVRIAAGGNVIIFGRLGDGAAFSTSAFLHADQTFPLYAVLYDGNATTRGSLRGNIQLPGSQTTDSLEWFKPARPRDTLFPGGFVVNAGMAFDAVRQ